MYIDKYIFAEFWNIFVRKAARKLAAEKAKAEAEAAQPEETAVEEVSEEKVAIFGKIRGKVKPVLIASVVASAAFKVIKMYVGRGLL